MNSTTLSTDEMPIIMPELYMSGLKHRKINPFITGDTGQRHKANNGRIMVEGVRASKSPLQVKLKNALKKGKQ